MKRITFIDQMIIGSIANQSVRSVSRIGTFILWVLLLSTSIVKAQNNSTLINSDLAKEFSTNDELFKEPYIDKDEWRTEPVRHRYIHGGFKGTDTRFSFYFPSIEKYQGPFFPVYHPCPG